MTDDPFLALLVEALNLMHPRFAAAYPHHEFYHQFRRLWDKALPVQLGLGHVIVQRDPDAPPGRQPDFLFWQLGEHGTPDCRLGAVCFYSSDRPGGVDELLRFRDLGYPYVVCIGHGEEPPAADGISRILYDTNARSAKILG